jgi:hypothetical protein
MKTHEKKAVASHTTQNQAQPEAAFEAVSFGDIPRALAQPGRLQPVVAPGDAPPMQLKLVRDVPDMLGGSSPQEVTDIDFGLRIGMEVYDDSTGERFTVTGIGLISITLRNAFGRNVVYDTSTQTYSDATASAAPSARAWAYDQDDPFGLNSLAAPSALDAIPLLPVPLAFGSASSMAPPAQLPAFLPPLGEERRKRGPSPTPLTRQAQVPQQEQSASSSTTKRAKPASPSTLLGPSALSGMSHVAAPQLPQFDAEEIDALLDHLAEEDADLLASPPPLSGSLAAPSGFLLPPLLSGSGHAAPLLHAPASPLSGLLAPPSPLHGLLAPPSPLHGLLAPPSPLPWDPFASPLHAPASPLPWDPFASPLHAPALPLPASPLPVVPAPLMNLELQSAMTPKAPDVDEIDEARAGRIFMRLQGLQFRNDRGNMVPVPYHYPLDGCYGRAEMMAQALDRAGYDSEKAFVVSKRLPALNVPSSYAADAPRGSVPSIGWQYHIASVIDVTTASGAVVKMVLDPSMFDGPVSVATWVGRMNPNAFTEETIDSVRALHQAHIRADASRLFSSMHAFPPDYHAVTVAPRTVMDPVNLGETTSAAESLRPSLPLMSRFADAAPAHALAAALRAALGRHAGFGEVLALIDGATPEARQIFRLGLRDGTRQVVAPYTNLIAEVKGRFPDLLDSALIDASLLA